jgi:hypothetical protein
MEERCELVVPAGATSAYVSVRGWLPATYQLTVRWLAPPAR